MSAEVVANLSSRLRDGTLAPHCAQEVLFACERDAMATARDALTTRADRDGAELQHYAATMVGVVAGCDGGWFFRVGDGVGVALGPDDACTVSLPEKGEYAN